MKADAFTRQHLQNWLDRFLLFDDDKEAVHAAMLAKVEEDPALMERGWPRVFDLCYPDGLSTLSGADRTRRVK